MRVISAFKKAPKRLIYSVVLPFIFATAFLQLLVFTEIQDLIDQNIFHPFVFRSREIISPQTLDSRIKILTFGDSTVSTLNAFDITLPEWGLLFREISKTKCHSILIDKLFDSRFSEDQIKQFTQQTRGLESRIGIIAFTYPEKIRSRHEISDTLVARNQRKVVVSGSDPNFLSSLNETRMPYGAMDSLLSQFTLFGHNEYSGDNHTKAFLSLKDSHYIPNAALTMADSIKFTDGGIYVNGINIHADSRGKILLNFAPRAAYKRKDQSFSFSSAFINAKRGYGVDVIKPGDYVVILPAMYTGNTDFKQTPFGPMPGGFTLVAIIQSILSGKWLREVPDPGFVVFIFGLTGIFLGAITKPRNTIFGLITVSLLTASVSVTIFVLFGIAWSFILPVLAITLGCLAGVIVHSSIASVEESRISRDLEVASLVHNSFFSGTALTEATAIRVQGGFVPATECGGDWWGTFHKNGYSYVMLGDAVGHGIPAALVTAVAFSVTRSVELQLETSDAKGVMPSRILHSINQVLCTINTDRACMTFQVFRIEDSCGECFYANAGNPQPILIPSDPKDTRLRNDQRIITLLARGNILGIDRETEFTDHTMQLNSGDQILLYTDGLIENNAKSTGEAIGKKWLKKELELYAQDTGDCLYDKLWVSYKDTTGALVPEDDVTIVVITAE